MAAMPTGQAQLHWIAPGCATDASSDLAPLLPSPAASTARPPLATGRLSTAGVREMVLPPRRPGLPAAGASTPPRRTSGVKSGKRPLGMPISPNSSSAAEGTGGQARKRGTAVAARAPIAHPDRLAGSKAGGDGDGASPVSVADVARRDKRAMTAPVAARGKGASEPNDPLNRLSYRLRRRRRPDLMTNQHRHRRRGCTGRHYS